ncbi:hypothetical protein SAMN05428642_101263 [Flaviramulus basaltis]|uniref:Uncharacterized protein n=1 Tax=Flaviramulus basaltis TaxID=369401 RepID=A0A1K2IAX5_9FLAO|nr:hypothetical protein [Flaviramulus basaltis]SFZ89426.1 hypothetical protein SAMN05428642_101263 [Flaviramulus basaltis]
MKPFCVFLFVLMLTSCEYFNVKKTSSEAILKEELQTFNWNDVDEYPSFSECDSLSIKEDKKGCFESVLTLHIWDFLKKEKLIVSQDIRDTMLLQFQVTKEGDLHLIGVKMDSITSQEIPNMNNLLHQSLDSLPKIFPAIKRAQQVTTEFKLPVIINVN